MPLSSAAARVAALVRHVSQAAGAAASGAASASVGDKWVLVYGGAGALGAALVEAFVQAGYKVASVDYAANARANVSVSLREVPWATQTDRRTRHVTDYLRVQLGEQRFRMVVCVAGGFAGGAIGEFGVFDSVGKMVDMNMLSSVAAGHMASKLLAPNGMLVLTGANVALAATPSLLAYGATKAAVHHVCASLAHPDGGLPRGARCVCIMPVMLDTPGNRASSPQADRSAWTPLEHVARELVAWAENAERRPANGALVSVVTLRGATQFQHKENPFLQNM